MFGSIVRRICVFAASKLALRLISRDDDPYLARYYICGKAPLYEESYTKKPWVIFSFLPTIYLHHFLRSDVDTELHNHPWNGLSFILAGGYSEERRVLSVDTYAVDLGGSWPAMKEAEFDKVIRRNLFPFMLNHIGKDDFHRVDLFEKDAWTIFITGEKAQSWGFWDRYTSEFIPWREHLARKQAENKG